MKREREARRIRERRDRGAVKATIGYLYAGDLRQGDVVVAVESRRSPYGSEYPVFIVERRVDSGVPRLVGSVR